jgi:hypothetical protein
MDNYILEIPNFVSPELCNEIVNIVKNDPNKVDTPPLNYSISGEQLTIDGSRRGIVMGEHKEYTKFIEPMVNVFGDVYNKYLEHLENTFKDYNKYEEYNMNPYIREIKSYKHVTIEGGFVVHEIKKGKSYKWHHDYDYREYQDFLQIIVYLNTLGEDGGGCTEIMGGTKIKPEIGKVVAFPRSWQFIHKGCKVLSETPKYICTSNIRISIEE